MKKVIPLKGPIGANEPTLRKESNGHDGVGAGVIERGSDREIFDTKQFPTASRRPIREAEVASRKEKPSSTCAGVRGGGLPPVNEVLPVAAETKTMKPFEEPWFFFSFNRDIAETKLATVASPTAEWNGPALRWGESS